MNKWIALFLLLFVSPVLSGDDTGRVLRIYSVTDLAQRRQSFAADDDSKARPFALLGVTTPRGRNALQPAAEFQQDLTTEVADVASAIGEIFHALGEDAEIRLSRGREHLLVRATPAEHQIFDKALSLLRRAAGRPLELELRHLTIAAAAARDPATRAALEQASSGSLDAPGLARLAAADVHQRARTIAVRAPLGEWTSIRAVRKRRYLSTYNVEIAQAAAIAEPVPLAVAEGLKAMVRPFLLRSGRILLRVVASAGDLDPELRSFDMHSRESNDTLRLRNTDYGILEQADYRGCVVSTEIMLERARSATLVFTAPDASEQPAFHVLIFTLGAAPEPAAADTLTVLAAGALATEDRVFSLRWNAWGELLLMPRRDDWSRLSPDVVEDVVGADKAADEGGGFADQHSWLCGGSVLLRAKVERASTVLAALDGLEREFIHGMNLQIRLLAGGANVGSLSAPLVAGRPVALAGYHKLDYVGDYSVDVAQEARIAEPVPMVGTEGIFLNGIVLRNGPRAYRLRGNLAVAGIPTPLRVIEPRTGGLPPLQALDRREHSLWLTLDLVPGRPQTLQLGPNPFDPEGKQILTAEVTLTER